MNGRLGTAMGFFTYYSVLFIMVSSSLPVSFTP